MLITEAKGHYQKMLVAQAGQHPALGQQHPGLDLGFLSNQQLSVVRKVVNL